MKSLHIRNLDEKVLTGLKRRAVRHRRSLQKEIEVLLEDAARMSPPEDSIDDEPELKLHTVSTGKKISQNTWSRDEIYGDDGR
jgi:plasmid stability protein